MRGSYLLGMWVKPRETIREITEENPNIGLKVLSSIFGFLMVFNLFQIYTVSLKMPFFLVLLLLLVLAPIAGYIYLSVASWILYKTGRYLKGKGSLKEIRAALAWSSLPLALSVVLWFFLLAVFGKSLFGNYSGSQLLTHTEIYLILGVTTVQLGFSLWAIILYLFSLAEVQKFSITNAILNTVIGVLTVLFLSLGLWILALYIWAYL